MRLAVQCGVNNNIGWSTQRLCESCYHNKMEMSLQTCGDSEGSKWLWQNGLWVYAVCKVKYGTGYSKSAVSVKCRLAVILFANRKIVQRGNIFQPADLLLLSFVLHDFAAGEKVLRKCHLPSTVQFQVKAAAFCIYPNVVFPFTRNGGGRATCMGGRWMDGLVVGGGMMVRGRVCFETNSPHWPSGFFETRGVP